MNRSAWSVMPAVMPQAAWPLWAIGSTGPPTNDAPATSHSGQRRWARYHGAGSRAARCGSLASSGTPLAVRAPAMAQLLDPPGDGAAEAKAARSSASRSMAGPAAVATGTLSG